MTVTPQTIADMGFSPADDDGVAPESEVEVESELEPQGSEVETDGEADDEGQSAGERTFLAVDEFSDHYVTIRVDGQDVEVPLSEALAGYSRQADYTRKTTELAQERERLASVARLSEWLEKDPAGTIKALQKALGVSVTATIGPDDDGDEETPDPYEARIRALEAEREQEKEAARAAAIVHEADAALASLGIPEARYTHKGVEQSGAEALLQFALVNQIGDLNIAAKLLKMEQVAVAGKLTDAETLAKKRAAAVVGGGRTRRPETVLPAKAQKMSMQEAYEAAKAALSSK